MAYELKRVKAPKLSGFGLRAVTALMETSLTRSLLLPRLLQSAGITEFRRLRPDGPPTLYPLVEPAVAADQDADGIALTNDVAAAAAQVDSEQFRHPTVLDYARAYRDNSVSPTDVAQHVIDAIGGSNQSTPPLRAIIQCQHEDVLRQARESSERLVQRRPRSILEGVPIAIKDELDMLPYDTTVGTRFVAEHSVRRDSAVVDRLRAAEALLVGKANMYEIGIAPMGNHPIHGFTRNPYDVRHDSGGSSSGCGAAVGAGIVPLAIGADGGGSVRIPAALCGVVGLKPTFGRISTYGTASLCWSVGHPGPLGATVLDAAIGYAICAGRDSRDRLSMKQPAAHLDGFHQTDLRGVTLGVYEPWFDDADAEVAAACETAMKKLESAGAVRKQVEIKGLEESRIAHTVSILTEMAAAMDKYYDRYRTAFSHPTRINLVLAREFSNLDYVRAQRVRTAALEEWDRVFSEVDVVMTPATACTAPLLTPGSEKYGESDLYTVTSLMHYAIPGNLCGIPAVSFPAGYDRNGLPVGLQAIGRHWEGHLLLRIANAAEQVTERRRPAVCYDPLSG